MSYDTLLISQPRRFYISQVVDRRTDTTLIGTTNGNRRMVFSTSPSSFLTGYFRFVLKEHQGQMPVVMQLLSLHSTDEHSGFSKLATCKLRVRLLGQDSAGLVNYGEYDAISTFKDEKAALAHAIAMRLGFAKVLNDLSARGLEGGTSLGQTSIHEDYQTDYPWPRFRAAYPDSLPDGLYENVATFRNAQIMKPGFSFIPLRENEEGVERLEITYTSGNKVGRKVKEGKFFVDKGVVYARSGNIFVPLIRHRNGFYLIGKKADMMDNNGARNGAIIAAGIGFGFIGAMVMASATSGSGEGRVKYLSKYILDMRTGKVVPEAGWEKHLQKYEERQASYLVLYSRKKDLIPTQFQIATGGDTTTHTLEGRHKLVLTLANDFDMHAVLGPGGKPVEFMAKPGYIYVKASRDGTGPTTLQIIDVTNGEFETKYLEAQPK